MAGRDHDAPDGSIFKYNMVTDLDLTWVAACTFADALTLRSESTLEWIWHLLNRHTWLSDLPWKASNLEIDS